MVNNTLIELKKLLNKMEEDVGLTSLSEVEKNVLYAIKDLEKEVDDTATLLKLIVIKKKIIKILVIDNFFNFINILFIKRPDIFPQNFLFSIY